MKIHSASEQVGLSIDTIRYYEKIGIIAPVKRVNGIRDFNERSINQLKFAKVMRKAGVTIEVLQKYLKYIYDDDIETIPKRRQLLINESKRIQNKIDNLVKVRDHLDYKIENYYNRMRKAENKLN